MKAVIFAAGRGTRISRHIDGKPKCTLELEPGKTLIQYSVELLRKKGVDDITLVLGYRSDVVKELLGPHNVTYVVNPFYDVTNSIASLWFAKDRLRSNERYILMNGDVFLSESALDSILAETLSPVLFYDTSRKIEADYKLLCEDGKIVKYGKSLSIEETSGEYIGCASLDASFMAKLADRLEQLIASQNHGMWWEDVLYSMVGERSIYAQDLDGKFWGEVDFIEDYERILQHYNAGKKP